MENATLLLPLFSASLQIKFSPANFFLFFSFFKSQSGVLFLLGISLTEKDRYANLGNFNVGLVMLMLSARS